MKLCVIRRCGIGFRMPYPKTRHSKPLINGSELRRKLSMEVGKRIGASPHQLDGKRYDSPFGPATFTEEIQFPTHSRVSAYS